MPPGAREGGRGRSRRREMEGRRKWWRRRELRFFGAGVEWPLLETSSESRPPDWVTFLSSRGARTRMTGESWTYNGSYPFGSLSTPENPFLFVRKGVRGRLLLDVECDPRASPRGGTAPLARSKFPPRGTRTDSPRNRKH